MRRRFVAWEVRHRRDKRNHEDADDRQEPNHPALAPAIRFAAKSKMDWDARRQEAVHPPRLDEGGSHEPPGNHHRELSQHRLIPSFVCSIANEQATAWLLSPRKPEE